MVEVAQYVAGPLAGSLLAELGAEVIKVEPPGGDAYRRVMPVAPGIGRYFVPLNRGKRSVVLDLKSAAGRAALARLVATADVVVHNAPPARAEAFGLALGGRCTPRIRRSSSASSPRSARTARSPATPAYDLVAQGRSGLLTSHASHGDRCRCAPAASRWPTSPPGTCSRPACWRRSFGRGRRGRGSSSRSRCSAPRSPCRSRISSGSTARPTAPAVAATRGDLGARADEIAGGLAMNPYYRCYEAADGFLAVACLNLAQRRGVPRRSSASTTDDRGARPRARRSGACSREKQRADGGDRAGDRGRRRSRPGSRGSAPRAFRPGRCSRARRCTPTRRCARTGCCRTSSSRASGR